MADVCINCKENILSYGFQINLYDRRKGLSGNWQFVMCDHCGLYSIIPMPNDEQLSDYYAAYSKDDKVDLVRGKGTHYPKLRKLFHCFSGDVDPRDFIVVRLNDRILDYGCGNASYLCDFHDRGFAISGAEVADHFVDACQKNGLDVCQVDDFSHIPFNDETFDIIFLMQVFEHLNNPHMFMQELARILKGEGLLYLALPNADSIWRKVFGKCWVSGWFVPYHLFIYNRNTLASMAGEYGFDVIESWSSTPESWFRLNLKAFLYPKENQLDWRHTWLDNMLIRSILMVFLRLIELPIRERDCLVMKLQKRE